MGLGKWKILIALLAFVGTIQSQSILLTSKQFDFYAKALIERNGLNDSLQECKEELQEYRTMVSNLEIKNTGTETALFDTAKLNNDCEIKETQSKDTIERKNKFLRISRKIIIACSAVIIAEAGMIYILSR